MSRSSWKAVYLHPEFMIQQQLVAKPNQLKDVVLFNRASVITKQMLGLNLDIYNGVRFFSITVSPDMIGHTVGEFAPTRKKPIEKKKKKK